MANDGFFTATEDWQPVELDSTEIQDGSFSLFNLSDTRVEIYKTDALPTGTEGPVYMKIGEAARKYSLSGADRLYVRASAGTALIGVIPA